MSMPEKRETRKKAGILIRDDWSEIIVRLTDEQAGMMIKTLCRYKLGMPNKRQNDTFIAATLDGWLIRVKQDMDEYEERCRKNSENQKRRWEREREQLKERESFEVLSGGE